MTGSDCFGISSNVLFMILNEMADGATRICDDLAAGRPDATAEEHEACGNLKFSRKNFHAAADFYTWALDIGAGPTTIYKRGLSYMLLKDYEKAKNDFLDILQYKFSGEKLRLETRMILAGAYKGLGDTATAYLQYEEALKIRPNWAEAYRRSAQLLMDTEKCGDYPYCFDPIIARFEKVLELEPDDADSKKKIGVLRQKREASIPGYVEVLMHYARIWSDSIYELVNKNAIVTCLNVVKLQPDNAEAWYLLSAAYLELTDEWCCNTGDSVFPCGDYTTEAKEAAIKAITLDPTNETYIEWARKLHNSGWYSHWDCFNIGEMFKVPWFFR